MYQLDLGRSKLKRTTMIAIIFMCLLTIPMVSLAAGFGSAQDANVPGFERALGNSAGVFSLCVTSSLNPTATLAFLSVLGALENAALYSDSEFLNNIADFLNGVPVIREAGKIPVANPWAAVFLTVVAIAFIALHSTAVTEAIGDYLHFHHVGRVLVNVQNVIITVLPYLHTDALGVDTPVVKGGAAAIKVIDILGKNTEPQGNAWYSYVLTGITFVALTICTNISYSCSKNGNTIAAAVPVKGTSLILQIIKSVFHVIILILQIYAPWVCFVICINLAIASFFLFRFLNRTARYYGDIYLLTIIHRIFRRNKPVSRIEKRVPRRLKKLYPNMEIAMSVYTFHGYARLAKRSRIWLIKEGDKIDLVYKRLIRKPYIISWSELREKHSNKTVYLEQCLRFLRIRTEDRKIELIMSNRYKPEAAMLSELLNLNDYAIVKQEIKETKKLNRKLRRERRKKKVGDVEAV